MFQAEVAMARKFGAALLTAVVLGGAVSGAAAGPYADELGKCLVTSTSTEDKSTLVKWIFAMAALHPAVRSVSAVNDRQRANLDKAMGNLFEELLADRCRTQTQEAVRYEGDKTIGTAFEVLGQAAMTELFSDATVAEGLGEFAKHIDQKKMEELLGKKALDN